MPPPRDEPMPVTAVAAVDPRVLRTRHDVLRTAVAVLLDEGWDAVSHAHVARLAGYSRATVYAHWPSRAALITDAFGQFIEVPHPEPTGDLRADLVAELISFRTAMIEHRLDRALAVLSDLTHSVPELIPVRERLVRNGERLVRELLAPIVDGSDLEVTTLMLCGAILHGALMHGQPPTDELIGRSVDLVLGAVPGR